MRPDTWEFGRLDWKGLYTTLCSRGGYSEDPDGADGKPRLRPRAIVVALLDLFRAQHVAQKEIAGLLARVKDLEQQRASSVRRSLDNSQAAAERAQSTQESSGVLESGGTERVVGTRIKVLDI